VGAGRQAVYTGYADWKVRATTITGRMLVPRLRGTHRRLGGPMATTNLPTRQQRWELTGAGLDSLSLAEREVPRPGAGELLVRIDACGICFSDIKILNLGGEHPRLQGRDMRREPVVMGHETAMTVVQVGRDLRDRFSEGQRFLIQADVYYGGEGMAFGYRLPGGYSQYQLIGREILDGDEGCYLLPVGERIGHAQAALCEPWACVEAAYSYQPRLVPKPDGRSLLILVETEEISEVGTELPKLHQLTVLTPVHSPWLHEPARAAEGVEALRRDHPDGFDDILFYGVPNGELTRHTATLLKPGGVLGIEGHGSTGRVPVDIGSVHYRDQWYTGVPAGDVYEWGRTTELMPGGIAWFIGAGGPLGQMHLQRALSLPRPPGRIIATQNGGPRLEELDRRFSGPAKERGIYLILLDSRALGEAVYEAVRQESGGRGCDDIVVIIPSAEAVERAYDLLAHGGGLNVFAGVPVGTTANLDLGRIASEGVRLWGTSGSKIADLQRIVEKVERGELATDQVVAAVGGIGAVKGGLEAVRDATFLGKTIVYPHCRDLPLTSVEELAQRHPSIRERLEDGRYWTPEAEAELFRLYEAG
jgi:L-sorbose 1-phosphate reductase